MASTTQGAKRRRVVIVVLAVLIVCCLIGAAIALLRSPSETAEPDAQGSRTASPQHPQAAPRQEGAAVDLIAQAARRDPDDPRAKGDFDAPVLMIEMSDYSCPMCSVYTNEIAPQLERYVKDGTLRIEFHDFAIFDDKYASSLGAVAGIAAGKQGKFWEFLTAAEKRSASDHPTWTPELAREIAQEAGVEDLDRFSVDAADEQALAEVRAQRATIASWGVQGTPAFFINDRFLTGAQPAEVFIDTIEAARADAHSQR